MTDGDFSELDGVLKDPVKLIDVLAVLCSDDIATRKITEDDFARAIGGDSLEAAQEVLLDALEDFLPSRLRGALASVRKAAAALVENQLAELQAELASLDARLAEANKADDPAKPDEQAA